MGAITLSTSTIVVPAMAAPDVPVLVVGAGPTGMMLSLWLQRLGVSHRIVDGASSSGQTSRALVVHARTLELYRQLGLAEAVIAKGTRIESLVVHHNGTPRGVVPVGLGGQGLSKYPFILSITQDEHEALQEATLAERGVTVERSVECVEATPDGADRMKVTLRAHGRDEHLTAGYVIGCDGAHSRVRQSAGIEMLGGTYDRAFFVADVLHSGPPSTQGQMNMCLSREDFCMIIPMPHQPGRARLIGFVPRAGESLRPEQGTFDDVRPAVARNAPKLHVDEVNWFARYRVHHRVAAHFRQGRVFLCGDAAHIHSPVGGQGMNTGLGDATNLAWKLAAVVRGSEAPDALLDTYEKERQPFAHKLVNTTDAMFTRLTGDGFLSLFLRNVMVPFIAPHIIRLLGLGPTIFKRVSQIEIAYRASPLSVDAAAAGAKAAAKAGDRLPWAEHTEGEVEGKHAASEQSEGEFAANRRQDNFAFLKSATWQVHVYGQAPAWATRKLADAGLTLYVFPWTAATGRNGLRRDVLYLVRPDGYIGLVLADQVDAEKKLEAYTASWGVGKTAR